MNKFILSIALACISGLSAHAQFTGKGYYRVQNTGTQRYMSLSDNHSTGVDLPSNSVDAGALVTKKNVDEVVTDPGTIFYIENISGISYNISAQGANVYNMINYYVNLSKLNDGTYRAWQTDHGQVLFLSDEDDFYKGKDQSYVQTIKQTYKTWYIKPVDTEDNYLGVKPAVESNGKYYATFFAEFPFSCYSTGMKVYYINDIKGNGVATYKEITGVVPGKTPVIIECSSTDPSQNKLKVEASSPAAIKDNKLTGVYFGMGNRDIDHFNCTPFNASTMRVLGVDKDGKLELNNADTYMADIMTKKYVSKYNYQYPIVKAIPHNTAYVAVNAATPTELKLYADGDPAGIVEINQEDSNKPAKIYNLKGMIVKEAATSTEGLPEGIYVFKGKKVVVK